MPATSVANDLPRQALAAAFRWGRGSPLSWLSTLPLLLLAVACAALAFVIYVLWPRWPEAPIALDAPALPVVIGDTVFQVPPAAIRVKVQRRPGVQERIDLAYLWPSLMPGATAPKSASADAPVFVTIATALPGALPPAERFRSIYPRYAEPNSTAGPNGLVMVAFRAGSPYQAEDLFFEAGAPDRFAVRCSRPKGPTPGTCLAERMIGRAEATFRFPREWLEDWRAVAAGINTLTASWQSTRN